MSALLPPEAASVKQCCAVAYGSDWARLLLGDSFHPGGTRLTDRLAQLLGLQSRMAVLDVAAGRGTSALRLASTVGCTVVGVDLSAANVDAANAAAAAAGLDDRVRFQTGDAERLPFPDASFDAVICECALCTFPDKAVSVADFRRVLRPGGRVGISDVVCRGPLTDDLQDLLAWVACIAAALPLDGYLDLLETNRFTVDAAEEHDSALLELAESIRSRLLAGRILAGGGALELPGIDWSRAARTARSAGAAIREGRLGYALISARLALG